MRLFVSLFIIAGLLFMYSLFNTGLSRFIKPNGGYTEGYQDYCPQAQYRFSPFLFLLFSVGFVLVLSLDLLGRHS